MYICEGNQVIATTAKIMMQCFRFAIRCLKVNLKTDFRAGPYLKKKKKNLLSPC